MFYNLNQFPFLVPFVENVKLIADEFNQAISNNFIVKLNGNARSLNVFQNLDFFSDTPKMHNVVDDWVKSGGFHTEQIGYDSRDGAWGTLPVYKEHEFNLNLAMEKLFPETSYLIKGVPNVNFVAFARLKAGSKIKQHRHTIKNLIFHLTLFDTDGISTITCSEETKSSARRGDNLIFDYTDPHSSNNQSTKDRINLLIDFTPSFVKQQTIES